MRYLLTMVLLTVGLGAPVLAQQPGSHGGEVVIADDHPVEFVSDGKELTFYVSEHDGSPMPMEGITGRAVVQSGGETMTVKLAPTEPNALTGELSNPLEPGATVVFFAKVEDHNLQARFKAQ